MLYLRYQTRHFSKIYLFPMNSLDRMQRDLRVDVARFSKQTDKKGKSRSQIYAEGREKTKAVFNARTRIPRGVMGEAVKLARSEYGGNNITEESLQKTLGPAKDNLILWRDTVGEEFEGSWEKEVELAEEAKKAAALAKKEAKGKGPATDVSGSGSGGHDDVDEDDDGDDDPEGRGQQESLRTCTATLRQILRPDLQGHCDRILAIAEDHQRELTNVIEEVSVLARKALHVVRIKLTINR
jgi:hypothetical protein